MVDFRLRTRTFKELFMLQHHHNCYFAHTTDRIDNHQLLPKVGFRKINNWKDLSMLCSLKKIDVIHTHNHPDDLGQWALAVRNLKGIPVVHEIHDMAYEHASNSAKQKERVVIPDVNELITVGPSMRKLIIDKYKKDSTIIYAYPNRNMLPKISDFYTPKRGIYQGGIRMRSDPKSKFNHRYYGDIFKKLVSQGLTIDVYPAYPLKFQGILGINFKKYDPDMKNLYKTISNYGFEFVGYNQTGSGVMDIAMPNKLFEAIACGVPVVAMDYHDIAKFVRKNNVGVVIDKNTLRLPSNYEEKIKKCRANLERNRNNYTMETQLIKINKIYRRALNGS